MKVLVFGAGGQLGKCLQDVYRQIPHDDIIFMFYDRNRCDITDSFKVNAILGEEKPDYVVNCAAYTNAYEAEFTPKGARSAYDINTIGAMNIANACNEHGAKMIQISTDYVFDGTKGYYGCLDEPLPINVYGRSKYFGEEAVTKALTSKLEEGKFLIIRTSWLFSKYSANSFTKMADAIKNGENVKAVVDQIGCPTYSKDLANFIIDVIVNETFGLPSYGICQYTNLGAASRYDIAKEIERFYGEEGLVEPITAYDSGDKVPRPKVCIMDKYWAQRMGKTRHWVEAMREFLTEYSEQQ